MSRGLVAWSILSPLEGSSIFISYFFFFYLDLFSYSNSSFLSEESIYFSTKRAVPGSSALGALCIFCYDVSIIEMLFLFESPDSLMIESMLWLLLLFSFISL